MTAALYALGRACARHRLVVVLTWLILVAGLAVGGHIVGQQTNDNLSLPGTDSQRATDVLAQKFPAQANGSNPITLEAPKGAKLTASKYENAVNQVVTAYTKDPAVRQAVSPLSSAGSAQLTQDASIGYISLTLKDPPSKLSVADANALIAVANPAKQAGIRVAAGGYIGQKVSKPSAKTSEVVGLIAAVVILVFTFGSVVAMGLPILTALSGLIGGLSILALISRLVQIPTTAPSLATMIGLGVGIDYGLFMVTRHREQLRAGMPVRESIARATATSGGAVLFAGSTVIIALLALALADIPLVTTLGYTAAIVVAIAMAAALTLAPAIMSLLGTRINALPLPGIKLHHDDRPHGWQRWARWVANHPWPCLAGGIAVLIVLAAPVRMLHLGQTDTGALPKSTQARQAYDAMSAGFGAGSNGPLLITADLTQKATNNQAQLNSLKQQQSNQQEQQQQQAQAQTQQLIAQGVSPQQAQQQVSAQQQQQQSNNASQEAQVQQQEQFLSSTASDPRLQTLRTDMQNTSGVNSVSQPLVNQAGTAAVYTVISDYAPSDRRTETLVNTLRDSTIPKATHGQGMTADVGGSTAGYIDLATHIASKLPLVIAVVLGLSFLLLMTAFRSLLVPLKAVLCNVLSIGAAFGVVTYAFGHDWSAKLLGLQGSIPIASYVPLMMFAILFGLSMDYEVFLMSHIRERWHATGHPHEAVIEGLAGTARVITAAALIMVGVFCAFILNGDPNIKQFGLGMAAAVAIDSTIVRCLLAPAVMSILDRAAWKLPRWLDRLLPRISIEGEEWFAQRDQQRQQPQKTPTPTTPSGPPATKTLERVS